MRKFAVAVAFGGLMSGASAADTIYTIGLGNSALSAFAGPYATATVSLVDADDATVTFNSVINSSYVFLMGGSNALGVNVNASSWTAGAVTETNPYPGFDMTPGPTNSGSKNVSDFGTFNQTFKNFDGFGHSATSATFTLHNNSGTWASSANVLTANADGYTVEIHGFVCALPGCSSTSGAVVTGFATDITTAVPEPETYAMLIAGLGLMGFVARRRKTLTAVGRQ